MSSPLVPAPPALLHYLISPHHPLSAAVEEVAQLNPPNQIHVFLGTVLYIMLEMDFKGEHVFSPVSHTLCYPHHYGCTVCDAPSRFWFSFVGCIRDKRIGFSQSRPHHCRRHGRPRFQRMLLDPSRTRKTEAFANVRKKKEKGRKTEAFWPKKRGKEEETWFKAS